MLDALTVVSIQSMPTIGYAQPIVAIGTIVSQTIEGFLDNIATALPRILTGIVFLAVSYVGIKLVMLVLRPILHRTFRGQPIYVRLVSTVIIVFLWFGVLLSFLTTVGLGPIAASLGTASGFLALGVSYALSDMIKDAVAGVYLIRDPDFEVGDRVVAVDMEGVVQSIELRKTRFDVGNDTVIRANGEVEKKWTLKSRANSETESSSPK